VIHVYPRTVVLHYTNPTERVDIVQSEHHHHYLTEMYIYMI
jgi:hypothetical protein